MVRLVRHALILLSLGFSHCGDPIVIPPLVLGPEWVVYTRENSPLLNNRVNALAVRDRDVWIGTDAGVQKIRESVWETLPDSFFYTVGPIESRKVTSIHIDRFKALWFGLAGGGVRYFNTNSSREPWARFKTPQLTDNFVYAVASDVQGEVWIATGVGVTKFSYGQSNEASEGAWRHYGERNSLIPNQAIRSLSYNYYDNTLWFGTTGWGAVSYDGDLDWNITMPTDQPLPILAMSFSVDRRIVFGTFGDWAYRYSIPSFEWTQVGVPDSGVGLPGNIVHATVVDGPTVWFGTNNGLARLEGNRWTVFNAGNSPLLENTVLSLQIDPAGNLWIGTTRGVYKYRQGGTVP